jgi:hypothetical protein
MNSKLFLYLICIIFISWQCAAIAPPSGGKKDTTPPELLSANPPNGTVRLLEQVIELTFSEYMDEKSFADGIRIVPVLEGEPLIIFKGDRVIVTLPGGIKNDMTVVLTLSRSIKDEHGVELAKPIQLAYSTGDIIDTGVIKGRVYSTQPAAVYLFNEDNSDSLLVSKPDYISETEDDGLFEFNYLSSGKYKILAVERGVAGLKLDQKRMFFGVPFDSGIELDSIFTAVRIRLFKEQEPLRLLRGEWNDWYWGQLYFNNDLDEDITIEELKIGNQEMDWFYHFDDKKAIIVTVQDSIYSNKEQISFKNIKLEHTVLLDSSVINVSIPAEVDTHYLYLTSPETKLSITPDKSGPPFELVFSRPLAEEWLENINIDLLMDDTIQVVYIRKIDSPMKMSIIPENGWEPKKSYQIKLFRQDSTRSKSTFKDSITIIHIETTHFQGYGGLSGMVKGYESTQLITEILSVENKEWNFKSVVNSEGRFEYKDIPESSYIFHVFDDRDQNKVYSYGKAFPFQTSEWFFISPDTIEVRANWDIELQPIFMGN